MVDICLIPEVPFELPKLLEHVNKILTAKGHCVVCVAEGAGQNLAQVGVYKRVRFWMLITTPFYMMMMIFCGAAWQAAVAPRPSVLLPASHDVCHSYTLLSIDCRGFKVVTPCVVSCC